MHAVQRTKPFVIEFKGAELLSRKLLGICMEMIETVNDDAQIVKSIEFTDDAEMREIGVANIHKGSIRINLREILDQILEPDHTPERTLSLRAEFVLQVIHAIGHECGHLEHFAKEPEFEKLALDRKEEYADDFATQLLIAMAERFDIEPEPLASEPYLGRRLQELFVVRGGDELFRRERRMLTEGLVYEDVAGLRLSRLRDFVHRKFADGVAWRQNVYPTRFSFTENEKGESVMHELKFNEAVFEQVEIEETLNPEMEEAMEIYTQDVDAAGAEIMAVADELDAARWAAEPFVPPVKAGPAVVAAAAAPAPMQVNMPTKIEAATAPEALALPPHIAAMMAGAAAGASVVVQKPSAPPTVRPNNYPAEKLIAFMQDVYKRLYFHLFNTCGWTGTPQLGAQDWHFSAPENVIAKPVSIADLIHAHGMPDVIVAYNTHDAAGRKLWGDRAERCENGLIRGEIFTNSKLPGYTLHCNFYGRLYQRVVAPQNTAKESTYAKRARGGECIAWVIKSEGEEGDKFLGHFANGLWVPSTRR